MARRARSRPKYTALQIALHWGVAALLGLQLVVNADVRAAFHDRLLGQVGLLPDEALALLHLGAGIAILALMSLRLVVKVQAPEQTPAGHIPDWIHLIARIAHWALYAVVIGMALAGLAAWLFASPFAGTVHEIGRLVLIVLIFAHVAGALVEHHMLSNPVLHEITGKNPPD